MVEFGYSFLSVHTTYKLIISVSLSMDAGTKERETCESRQEEEESPWALYTPDFCAFEIFISILFPQETHRVE